MKKMTIKKMKMILTEFHSQHWRKDLKESVAFIRGVSATSAMIASWLELESFVVAEKWPKHTEKSCLKDCPLTVSWSTKTSRPLQTKRLMF